MWLKSDEKRPLRKEPETIARSLEVTRRQMYLLDDKSWIKHAEREAAVELDFYEYAACRILQQAVSEATRRYIA